MQYPKLKILRWIFLRVAARFDSQLFSKKSCQQRPVEKCREHRTLTRNAAFRRAVKWLRHRFGQPWLFVSSGNAKGKGGVPSAPRSPPPSSSPFTSSSFSSCSVKRTHRKSAGPTRGLLLFPVRCPADRGNSASDRTYRLRYIRYVDRRGHRARRIDPLHIGLHGILFCGKFGKMPRNLEEIITKRSHCLF